MQHHHLQGYSLRVSTFVVAEFPALLAVVKQELLDNLDYFDLKNSKELQTCVLDHGTPMCKNVYVHEISAFIQK